MPAPCDCSRLYLNAKVRLLRVRMVGLGQSCVRMQHATGTTLEYCRTASKLHRWLAAACEDLSIGRIRLSFYAAPCSIYIQALTQQCGLLQHRLHDGMSLCAPMASRRGTHPEMLPVAVNVRNAANTNQYDLN